MQVSCSIKVVIVAGFIALHSFAAMAQATLQPRKLPMIAEVNSRFLSYNVEAVEITGGRFWKPFDQLKQKLAAAPKSNNSNEPTGIDSSFYAYRPPIDLKSEKLKGLAKALSPAYMRVSGTWKNNTYFQDNDDAPMSQPPSGFKGVITRAQWKGAIDFAKAVDADVVTSFATSKGTRDANNVWTTDQAKAFLDYTKRIGGHIAATEFMNEPNFAEVGGAPAGYDAAMFGKDVAVFAPFIRKESPETIYLGPSGTGEGASIIEGPANVKSNLRQLRSEDLLRATGPVFDAFSYHYYGTASHRCTASLGPNVGLDEKGALKASWLQKNVTVEEFYAHLRDQFLPGKQLWLTETGEASCGGDQWASTFLDSFRFMDQLGALAQRNVQTVMVNTLASSDYGLLDDETFDPRPNYWAALIWKRTMGSRVLKPEVPSTDTLRVYAQCTVGSTRGSVSYLLVNLDDAETKISIPLAGVRNTLTAPAIDSKSVLLNGKPLALASDGSVPATPGDKVRSGNQTLPAYSISLFTFPAANNSACQ